MRSKLLLSAFLCLSLLAFSQDGDNTISRESEAKPSGNSLKLGISSGPVFFFGDVGMDNYTPSITQRLGYSLIAQQPISNGFSIALNLFSGKVYGETQNGTENINFRTSIFSQSLSCYYHFLFSSKDKPPLLSPFVSAGVETIAFRPKADLKDEDGKTYNYWSDGTIRDLPEIQQNIDNAVILNRDYEYETELRDLNLDSFGKYPQFAFSVPLSAGLDINLGKTFALRLEGSYHLAFTDYMDNITGESIGSRQGEKGNDSYLYTSIGMAWAISPSQPKVKAKPPKDSDGDGIANHLDKCKKTPKGTPVDENGCPVDVATEKADEIAEGEQNENENGKENKDIGETKDVAKETGVQEEKVENTEQTKEDTEEITTTKEITSKPDVDGKFHWADLNKNGSIETEEVYHFIERFLEGDKEITIKEMDDLLEYYFEQD